ncbi:MAG: isoprenylcysteine carboxylmethyltransferase family protein [Armatimonadota bacterium]|nr:isoprenylcysteine carboxylmethyltransferase family protein [Armatimonadota bacterium]
MNKVIHFLWRRRTTFMAILGFAVLVVGRPAPRYVIVGVPLILAGQAIRLLAAGYLSKDNELITAGPYALCRNPLYVGSFLISCGYLAIFGRLDVFAIGIVLFWLFHGGAVIYEENKLRSVFGSAYTKYVAEVPRFLPRSFRYSGNGAFSWRLVISNNEHRTAVLNVILSAAIVVNAFTLRVSPLSYLISLVQ